MRPLAHSRNAAIFSAMTTSSGRVAAISAASNTASGFTRHVLNELASLIAIRQRQHAARAEVLDLAWNLDGIADQGDRACAMRIIECDVLQEAQLVGSSRYGWKSSSA